MTTESKVLAYSTFVDAPSIRSARGEREAGGSHATGNGEAGADVPVPYLSCICRGTGEGTSGWFSFAGNNTSNATSRPIPKPLR